MCGVGEVEAAGERAEDVSVRVKGGVESCEERGEGVFAGHKGSRSVVKEGELGHRELELVFCNYVC